MTGFAEDSPHGHINSLSASPPQKLSISFPSVVEIIKSTGLFSFCIFSEEVFEEKIPGSGFTTSHHGDYKASFVKYKGAPRAYVTAGPTSQGGRGSVAARRRPRPRTRLSAQQRRPTRASGGRPGLRGSGRRPLPAGALGGGAHLGQGWHLRPRRRQAWGRPAPLLPSQPAAARASPAGCPPASPRWAACRSPASWRR